MGKACKMQGVVLQMREGGGRGGRGGNANRSRTNSTAQRTARVVLVNGNTLNQNATTNDNSVISKITERGLQNGRSFGRGAYGNNLHERTSGARTAHAIISSARCTSTKRSEVAQSHPGHRGSNEIDDNADRICAGLNWRLLELSGEYCNVSPFSADYQRKTNIAIAKCATTYTCPSSGDSVVLVADQVLWFGNELYCLLISPDQIRSHEYSVCEEGSPPAIWD